MVICKPNVRNPSTTSGTMGQWSSGYNTRRNVKISSDYFGEKTGEYPSEKYVMAWHDNNYFSAQIPIVFSTS